MQRAGRAVCPVDDAEDRHWDARVGHAGQVRDELVHLEVLMFGRSAAAGHGDSKHRVFGSGRLVRQQSIDPTTGQLWSAPEPPPPRPPLRK